MDVKSYTTPRDTINLEMRMGFNPAQNDALDKAKESFRNEDCSRLLFQFPEIYHYVKL